MFLIKIISKNSNVELLLYFFLLMFIFYSLGKIIQNKISFRKNVSTLAIPFGFVSYLLITQIFYVPLIFFSFEVNTISFIENLKEFLLLIFISSYYRDWIPKNKLSSSNVRTISLKIFFGSFLISGFFVMSFYLNWFMPTIEKNSGYSSYNFLRGIENLASGSTNFFNTHTSSIASGFEKYESTYYWIANISSTTKASTKEVLNIFIPLLSIIVLFFIVNSFIINLEKSTTTHFISFFISVIFIFFLGVIGSENELFLSYIILMFISFLLLSFSLRKDPNNREISISLFLLILFSCVTYQTIFFMIIFGAIITFVSLQKNSGYVFNVFLFLNILFGFLTTYILLVFPTIMPISKALYYLSISILVSAMFIVPVYSLWSSDERKKEQSSFEKNFNKKPIKYTMLISFSLIFIILLINKLEDHHHLILSFEMFFQSISDKLWLSITLWIFIIIVPSIFLLIFKRYVHHGDILITLGFVNLLFINPITLTYLLSIFQMNINIFYIFIPTALLLFLWLVEILMLFVRDKLRL